MYVRWLRPNGHTTTVGRPPDDTFFPNWIEGLVCPAPGAVKTTTCCISEGNRKSTPVRVCGVYLRKAYVRLSGKLVYRNMYPCSICVGFSTCATRSSLY